MTIFMLFQIEMGKEKDKERGRDKEKDDNGRDNASQPKRDESRREKVRSASANDERRRRPPALSSAAPAAALRGVGSQRARRRTRARKPAANRARRVLPDFLLTAPHGFGSPTVIPTPLLLTWKAASTKSMGSTRRKR